jgi:hypothetical protein
MRTTAIFSLAVPLIALMNPLQARGQQFGTVIEPDVGLSVPNPHSFQQSRSVCVDPVTGTTWVFYLKRMIGADPEWRIVVRQSPSWSETLVVASPAPDFTIACRPPQVWLGYADAHAMTIYMRKGTISAGVITWSAPSLVARFGLSFAAQTPSLAWLPDGRPVVAYWGNDQAGFFRTMASVATDTEGLSWSQPGVLARGGHVRQTGQPSVAVWGTDNTVVALSFHDPSVLLNTWSRSLITSIIGPGWSRPVRVATNMARVSQVSGLTGRDGKAHLLYSAGGGAWYATLTPKGLSVPLRLGTTGEFEACMAVDGSDLVAVYGRIRFARIRNGQVMSTGQLFSLREKTQYLFTQCNEHVLNGQLALAWTEGLSDQHAKIVTGIAPLPAR